MAYDEDILKFKTFVKDLAVINDCSERAVKTVQDVIKQTLSEKKLQRFFLSKTV